MLSARKRSKGLGFTLIETLVVMAIIAILVGAGMGAYIKFNNKRKVEQAALDFASYLKIQQKKADAGEKPTDCLDNDLVGYQVNTEPSTEIATARVLCGISIPLSAFNLNNRAQFSVDPFNVTFNVLSLPPTITGGITHIQGNGYSYKVNVSDGGVITVESEEI